MTTCIGRDPLCPCADGDACHYRDTPTTKGWPTFSQAEMHKPHLIERLRECLPTAADGPDHRVWCNVRGSDLREAVAELEVQREALPAPQPERLRGRRAAAEATVTALGYTYHGGELWKPPLGPVPLTDAKVTELRSQHGWAKETIRAIERAIREKS